MMKLVALGDSIVKGVLFNQEENGRWHYALSDHNMVDYVADQLHCEAINLGKMGCTIENGERILSRSTERLDGANYVLICYGGNDSDYNWKAIADFPEAEHHPKTPLSIFEKTYVRVINKVKEMGYTPLVLTLPPINAQQYFEHFTQHFDEGQKKNVLKWLKGNIDTIWAGHELYNDVVKRVATATNTRLIDVNSALLRQKDYLCEDGIHPNNKGQFLIAKSILSAI